VRQGNGTSVYTIGYERRSPEELISLLQRAGVDLLIDARDRPVSRRAGFSAAALQTRCEAAGLDYEAWTELGSTPVQRERLQQTGDIARFRSAFRSFAKKHRSETVERLAKVAKRSTIALLCYEREHDSCHRGVLAELLAEQIDATIWAI
jgi:uncharacterized protein (DUF488 family)